MKSLFEMMFNKTPIFAIGVLVLFSGFCFAGQIVDPRDNHVYKTAKFGNKVWMVENLNFKTNESLCYNQNDCEKFGRYYRWKEAVDACPDGWHLPAKGELDALMKMGPGNLQSPNGFALQQAGAFGGQDELVYNNDWSYLWSSTSVDECGGDAEMGCFYAYVLRSSHFGISVVEEYYDADILYSVRCVKD